MTRLACVMTTGDPYAPWWTHTLVIFDVETIFLFPWAILFDELLWFGLIEMGLFLGILLLGYWYAWEKKALEWD